ncbi:TadE family protein [Agromyces sp. MMS24-JH15]|uniref:TadE family protein n=1 Tax=Agromyces sp. MMS24-JH15 TaxID=3243765 RepID=UPI003748C87F
MHADDRGSASLEFLTVGLILLVPLVYLVLAIGAIQAGSLAVEGAARHAARVAVRSAGEGRPQVEPVVLLALADYGIGRADTSVDVVCDPVAACGEPGTRMRVDVVARVRLPLVPEVLGLDRVSSVVLRGSATQTVSRFAVGGGG